MDFTPSNKTSSRQLITQTKKKKKLTHIESFPSNISLFSAGADLKPEKTHKKRKRKNTPTNPEKSDLISGQRSCPESPRLGWRELRQ